MHRRRDDDQQPAGEGQPLDVQFGFHLKTLSRNRIPLKVPVSGG
jgi:hypothetical protein